MLFGRRTGDAATRQEISEQVELLHIERQKLRCGQ
jgi:hypothetical protein